MVENATDEDWNDVRMVLVSGRPISFQMDLYPPLYVPRPTVEPELFASLRPPTYNGAMTNNDRLAGAGQQGNFVGFGGFGGQGNNLGMAGIGGIGGLGGLGGIGGLAGGLGGGGNGMVGQQGGQFGQQGWANNANFNRYQGNFANPMNPGQMQSPETVTRTTASPTTASTFEQLQERRRAAGRQQQETATTPRRWGEARRSATRPASEHRLGGRVRGHRRRLPLRHRERVSLPRQKSALLPLLDKGVAAARVSIFNESCSRRKYPMLGLRFKNTTGQPLAQGPITVYEDSSYAGDARLPDLQPGEERLLSYAVDLGTEVKSEDRLAPGDKMALRTAGNAMQVHYTVTEIRKYTVHNRSKQDRLLVIEHPIRTNWKLAEGQKPREQSRDVYRFDVPVKAGATAHFEVREEQGRVDPFAPQWAKTPSAEVAETHFATNLNLEVDQLIRTAPVEFQCVKIVKGELQATSKHAATRTSTC